MKYQKVSYVPNTKSSNIRPFPIYLNSNDGARILKASFREWKYSVNLAETRNGGRIKSIRKEPNELDMTIIFSGSADRRIEAITELYDALEQDIIDNNIGKLAVEIVDRTTSLQNIWYIDCITTSIKTYPNSTNSKTLVDLVFFCPNSMWYKMEAFSAYKTASTKNVGLTHDSDAIIEIKALGGNVANPAVKINDFTYRVNTSLQNGEYVTIDTENKTITKTNASGETTNAFHLRDKTVDNFHKIRSKRYNGTPGIVVVDPTISGQNTNVTINANIERAIPLWM